MRLGRGILAVGGAIVAVLVVAGCSSPSQFDDPTNPVAQIPWPDYERLSYAILDQTDTELGSFVIEVERDGDEWVFTQRFDLEATETVEVRRLRVDAETLRPIEQSLESESGDERVSVRGVYGVDAEGGLYVDAVVEQDGERESERVAAGEFAFDNDSSPWLWRSVAFGPDLELTYRSVNVFQRRSQLVQLAVRGQDTLRGPEGDVVVWQVVVTPGVEISRAWYEVDAPHRLIRWDQQPRRYLLREVSTVRGE